MTDGLCRQHDNAPEHPECADCRALTPLLPKRAQPSWPRLIGAQVVALEVPILDKKAAKKDAKRRYQAERSALQRLAQAVQGRRMRNTAIAYVS